MIELTSEQTPNRIDEYNRIIQKNGSVIPIGNTLRLQGVLDISRAIGDLHYKEYMSCEPEIKTISL